MVAIIWSLLTSRFGGWIVGGIAVFIVLGILKLEHNARLREKAKKESALQALKIGQEGYEKLYQEREQIKDKANQQRRKVNDLQQKLDYYGLSDLYNKPTGVQQFPNLPVDSLKPLPAIEAPVEPVLHTVPLLDDVTGKPAGLLFPGDDAFVMQQHIIDLREAVELNEASVKAANRIFEILRTPPKKWYQFWRK